MRRLNTTLLLILVGALGLLGGSIHLVHGIQIRRNAAALLQRARQAEADGQQDKVVDALAWYLSLMPDDDRTWAWYARVQDRPNPDLRRAEQVFLIYEQALRHGPSNRDMRRRCARLAIDLGRFADARGHIDVLLEAISREPVNRERAELEDMRGQCEAGLSRHEAAEAAYALALRHDPHLLPCYEHLARLQRTGLRRPEAADATIREMVARNPKDGLAYLYRWRYAREFGESPDANDLQIALGLAPENPEVLLAAAATREQEGDLGSSRRYYEQGSRLDPGNAAFALGLARLEIREGHPDRAEAVLRRATRANSTWELVFFLAESLILQGKIEGDGSASEPIAVLRKMGYGNTLVLFLEAEVRFRRAQWAEAIPALETCRAVLKSSPVLSGQIDLMLAECYGRLGWDILRREALGRAAGGDRPSPTAQIAYARSLAEAGRLDEALGVLLPLRERMPELGLDIARLVLEKTARKPVHQRDWREAERHLEEAAAALPRAGGPLTLLRADLLAERGRVDEARSLLAGASDREPRNLAYRLAMARLADRAGQPETALRILDDAERELGPNLEIRLARLDHWGRAGDDAARAAVAAMATTIDRVAPEERPSFLDRLAAVELRLGLPDRARAHWRAFTALRPANARVLMSLFDLAIEADDHEDAIAITDRLRELEGDQGTLWRFGRAACLLDRARRGQSVDLKIPRALAAEIAQRRPSWWGASIVLAQAAEVEGRTEEAIQEYTHAIELGDDQPVIARHLAALLDQNHQLHRIEHVVEVLSARGVEADGLLVVAALRAIRGHDFDRGLALARRVYSGLSTHYADHLALARFNLAAGRHSDAGDEFRRAVELGPGVPVAWLNYVEYLVGEGRIDQARAAAVSASRALRDDRARPALARCFAMVGDLAKAEALIQSSLGSSGRDLETLRIAAEIYLDLGRTGEVAAILDRLRDPAMKATPAQLAWANRTQAVALMNTGRLDAIDRALALVESNRKAGPGGLDDDRLAAVLLSRRTSRRAEAVRILETLDESGRLEPEDQFLLARLFLAARADGRYRTQMLKILGTGSRKTEYLRHYVDFLIDRNELDQATYWLAELQKTAPASPDGLELEGRLLHAKGRDTELRDRLVAWGRQFPDRIGIAADLLARFGCVPEAETAYRAFIARAPGQPERVLPMAAFLARQGRVPEALSILEKAEHTCRPERVAAAALSLYDAPSANEGHQRRVEAFVVRAITDRPESAPLVPKLAAIRLREGRYDEAEALFRRALAANPDDVEALYGLAWLIALSDSPRNPEALKLVDRAIEIRGDLPALLETRAVVQIRAGRLDPAIDDLNAVRALDPTRPSVSLHLAWAYQARGDSDRARRLFQKAIEQGWSAAKTDPRERAMVKELRGQLSVAPEPESPATRRLPGDSSDERTDSQRTAYVPRSPEGTANSPHFCLKLRSKTSRTGS